MALAALLYHGGTPIGFYTFLSALALLVIAASAGIAANRRAGIPAAVLAILLIGTSDGLGESAALRGVDLLSTAAIAAALAVAPEPLEAARRADLRRRPGAARALGAGRRGRLPRLPGAVAAPVRRRASSAA